MLRQATRDLRSCCVRFDFVQVACVCFLSLGHNINFLDLIELDGIIIRESVANTPASSFVLSSYQRQLHPITEK